MKPKEEWTFNECRAAAEARGMGDDWGYLLWNETPYPMDPRDNDENARKAYAMLPAETETEA